MKIVRIFTIGWENFIIPHGMDNFLKITQISLYSKKFLRLQPYPSSNGLLTSNAYFFEKQIGRSFSAIA